MKTFIFLLMNFSLVATAAGQDFFCRGDELHSVFSRGKAIAKFDYSWKCSDALETENALFLCAENVLYGAGLSGSLKVFDYDWQCTDAIKTADRGFICDKANLLTFDRREVQREFNYDWECTDYIKALP